MRTRNEQNEATGTFPKIALVGPVKCRRPVCEGDADEFDADVFASDQLTAFMAEVGLTNVSLADAWEVSESIVRDVKTRHKPFTVSKLARMPAREREMFFRRLCAAFDARRAA